MKHILKKKKSKSKVLLEVLNGELLQYLSFFCDVRTDRSERHKNQLLNVMSDRSHEEFQDLRYGFDIVPDKEPLPLFCIGLYGGGFVTCYRKEYE